MAPRGSRSAPLELVDVAEIARRLELSGERVRQLASSEELPPPVGRVGRSTVWRWDDVRLWAAASGRLPIDDLGRIRSLPLILANPEAGSDAPLRLDHNEVFWWDNEHAEAVHLRIWRPEPGSNRTPVVVLGALTDVGWSLTNRVEAVAQAVMLERLGLQGLDAQWFEYWPGNVHVAGMGEFSLVSFEIGKPARAQHSEQGSFHDPQWIEVSKRHLESFIGDDVDTFDEDVYTEPIVTQYTTASTLPVTVEWDPGGTTRIANAARLIASSPPELDFDDGARHAAASLLWATCRCRLEATEYRIQAMARSPLALQAPDVNLPSAVDDDDISPPRAFSLAIAARSQLARRSEADAMHLLPGPSGPAWSQRFASGGLEPGGDVADLDPSDPPTDALRVLDVVASRRAWSDADLRATDVPVFLVSRPLDADAGHATTSYLDAVSWWGPTDEDRLRWRRLRLHLDPATEIRAGYDPRGRLVAHDTAEGTFVTEWPTVASAQPDDARVVADETTSPAVFVAREGQPLDLLSMDPADDFGPSLTWGYPGAGPNRLAAALMAAATGRHASREALAKSEWYDRLRELIYGINGPLDVTMKTVRELDRSERAGT